MEASPLLRAPLLPTALAGLHDDAKSALHARQKRELAGQEYKEFASQDNLRKLGQVAHYLAIQTLCNVSFAFLLWWKRGAARRGRSYVSWAAVLAPLFAACACKIVGAARVIRLHMRAHGGALATESVPQVCYLLDGVAWLGFYLLLLRCLEGGDTKCGESPCVFLDHILLPI